MKIGFILEYDGDKVSNLNLANAILAECEENPSLDAKVIAKAILLEAEREKRNENG